MGGFWPTECSWKGGVGGDENTEPTGDPPVRCGAEELKFGRLRLAPPRVESRGSCAPAPVDMGVAQVRDQRHDRKQQGCLYRHPL